MIKNDELVKMRERAERSGEAEDVWKYVEELEARLSSPHSAMLHDPGDSERTEQTAAAHQEGTKVLNGQLDLDGGVGFVTGPVQIVVMPEATYAIEVRGQASATAHGFQGFRSSRGELLRHLEAIGLPVFVAFRDGGVWETAWLSELGPARALRKSADRDEARYGWYAGEKPERGEPLFERKDYLSIPLVHEPRLPPQEGLV